MGPPPHQSEEPAGASSGDAESSDEGPRTLTDRAAAAFTAYRDGQTQQIGVLVDLLTPLLWHTARGQGLSAPAAEDVVQTAWLKLLDHLESIGEPRAVLSWMVTTVRRESWRQAKVAARDSADLEGRAEVVDTEPGPETWALLGERQRVLWRHVRQLSERCQHLLRVIAFADRPDYATIADSLKMPVGSIGPTRGRCLKTLRTGLAGDPEWDGVLT
ncbi:MAG TPA: sigma-70 family RNA polymerase sigma factor [Ornithinimicrobium sp.]|uniref:RNA polymerase sigma factor n=1 Tax=Ornithinimicrobium sp. TaxID=1977084 RepID=UPI002B47FFA6|nr:sigma-70 family RNA polymerase sigma factor [Ornithinimicrobium sp.]HKJ11120.1 sigma-70 family RNA polymerase sigma factor [Ornithinimicrobium sp.]